MPQSGNPASAALRFWSPTDGKINEAAPCVDSRSGCRGLFQPHGGRRGGNGGEHGRLPLDRRCRDCKGRRSPVQDDGRRVARGVREPLNSVRCAAGIRNALVLAEQGQDPPLTMRFGLHLADVIVDGDDLIGDGVNLAARIQQAAEPGAIDLSGSLFEQIRRTSPYAFEDRGDRSFRNIAEPVRVYRLGGEIRRHRYQITPTQAAPSRLKRPHSVAVMPFEVPAGDKDRRFLAEGIAEELIFDLGRFRKLFVTSRSATRALEGTQADPQGVGGRLGVRYVLTGTIRQLGPRVRLSLTLTETDTGTVVWSDRLSESLGALVDKLDDLVSRIASTVLGRIEERDIVAARRLKPESMTAYEFHLRGLEYQRLGRWRAAPRSRQQCRS